MDCKAVPTQRGKQVRVWIAASGLKAGCCPVYEGCIIPGGVDWANDLERKLRKCPGDGHRGFDIVDVVEVETQGFARVTLKNRFPANIRSLFLELYRERCSFDMVWAYGLCDVPSQYNQFDKIEVFSGIRIVNYSHDEVGAFDESTLADDVLETIELEILDYYDYARLNYNIAGELPEGYYWADIKFCDEKSCASNVCGHKAKSDGCQRLYGLVVGETNQGTTLFFYYSKDSGRTWDISVIATGANIVSPKLICTDGYVVVSNSSETPGAVNYWYAEKGFHRGFDAEWIPVNDGLTGGYGFGCYNGYNILFSGFGGNVKILPEDRIGMFASNLLVANNQPINEQVIHINCYRSGIILLVTQSGKMYKYEANSLTPLSSLPLPYRARVISAINPLYYIVFDDTGLMWFTYDGGFSWDSSTRISQTPTSIAFDPNGVIGYAVTQQGIWRTADGGCSWILDYQSPDQVSCGVSICKNGNKLVTCRGRKLIIASDSLTACYGKFLYCTPGSGGTHPCPFSGIYGTVSAELICEDGQLCLDIDYDVYNPDGVLISWLVNVTYNGSTTQYPISNPMIICGLPFPEGQSIDVTVYLSAISNSCNYISEYDYVEIPCTIAICDDGCVNGCGGIILCDEC